MGAGAVVRTWEEMCCEATLVMVPSALQPSVTMELTAWMPQSIIQSMFPAIKDSQSKLALFLHLKQLGWEPMPGSLVPRKPGDPKHFEMNMLERSYLYFAALANEPDIYMRGSTCIHHGMTQGYYKCLMNVGALQEPHKRPGFPSLKDKGFEANVGIAMKRFSRFSKKLLNSMNFA